MKLRMIVAAAMSALLATMLYAPGSQASITDDATMIGDINQVSSGSAVSFLTNFNNAVYFQADDGTGAELWKSSGGQATKVVDLSDTATGSLPYALTVFQNKLYFFVILSSGTWLYSVDSSDQAIALLQVGSTSSYVGSFQLKASMTVIYFTKEDDQASKELFMWSPQSGGADTIVQVTFPTDGRSTNPLQIIVFNDNVLFSAYDINYQTISWQYDGKSLDRIFEHIFQIGPSTVFDGKLYFSGADLEHGPEIWTYDGSTVEMLVDYLPGFATGVEPKDFTVMGEILYFIGKNEVGGNFELLKWDGSRIGLVEGGPVTAELATGITLVGSKLYVTYSIDGSGVHQLWTSDGSSITEAANLPDFYTWQQLNQEAGTEFVAFDGDLFYPGAETRDTDELVRVDPATDTIVATVTANESTSDAYPGYLTEYKDKVYFIADNGTNSSEIWFYDGTSAPQMLMDINPGAGYGLGGNELLVFDDKLYFAGNDGVHGSELWVYDGVNDPRMIEDLTTGSEGAYPVELSVFNNELYFVGNYNWLYKMSANGDITEVPFDSINTEEANRYISSLEVFDNKLYFKSAFKSAGGDQRSGILHQFDGTNPATPVGDPTIALTNVYGLVSTPGYLYITGTSDEYGTELFRLSEGETNPELVNDSAAGSNSSYPSVLGYFNDMVYFRAYGWPETGIINTVSVDGTVGVFESDNDETKYITSMKQIGETLYWVAPMGTYTSTYTAEYGVYSKTGDQAIVLESSAFRMRGMDQSPSVWTFNGTILFNGEDGTHGRELFRLGGTSMVERLNKTKIITAFKANKPVLSWNVKKSIRTFVLANPTATVAKCVGRTAVGKQSWAEKKLARDRATAVCNYATSVQSGISKWISSGPGKQAGKAFSRVALTLRN
jgi:ELWxxDGT repeat protein